MNTEQHGENSRKYRDVKSKKTRERCARDLFAAAQKNHHGLADDWNNTGDIGANLRCKICKFIPRQEVAAEAEAERKKEHQHAGEPGDLAGLAVRFLEEDAEHVNHRRKDEQVRRPAVNRPDEPAELDLRHDKLNTLKREFIAPFIVHQQKNSGQDLNDKQEQGDAAKIVPHRMAIDGDVFLSHEFNQVIQLDPFI